MIDDGRDESRRHLAGINGMPAHRDAQLMARLTASRELFRRPNGVVLLSGRRRIIDLVKRRRLDKVVPRRRAFETVEGHPALEAFVRDSLILADGDHHRRLRQAANRLWDETGDRLLDAIAQRIRAVLNDVPVEREIELADELGDPCSVAVVEEVLGLAADPDVASVVHRTAPVLNRLVTIGEMADDAAAWCSRSTEMLRRNLESGPAGSDYGLLQSLGADPTLDTGEAVHLALFVATAAVETTRSLSVACALAAPFDGTAFDIVRCASPAPVALYGAAGPIESDGERVSDSDVLLVNLGDMPFGVGPHFCLGARIALVVGDTLLAEMRSRRLRVEPIGRPAWNDELFVRPLVASGRFVRDG